MEIRKNLFRWVKVLIFWRNLLSYKLHHNRPWKRGYFEHKWKLIEETLNDQKMLSLFRETKSLPEHFGQRIDERIVEYPWLMANLPSGPAKLLDAGSALNFQKIISRPELKEKEITIVTLHPEANCFWDKGISYVFTDLRDLPFKSDSFAVCTCVSTLEHVGMDNTKIYTTDSKYQEKKVADYLLAVSELKRVLKTGGTLLITVPFGQYEDFGFFQQFNQEMIDKIIKTFAPTASTATFYRYDHCSWQISNSNECASAKYITAREARLNPLLPAAAGAVACLKLIK